MFRALSVRRSFTENQLKPFLSWQRDWKDILIFVYYQSNLLHQRLIVYLQNLTGCAHFSNPLGIYLFFIDKEIDFNGMSTSLGLFYAVEIVFRFTFCEVFPLSYRIRIIFKQFYLTHR